MVLQTLFLPSMISKKIYCIFGNRVFLIVCKKIPLLSTHSLHSTYPYFLGGGVSLVLFVTVWKITAFPFLFPSILK